jgi:Restriction endonuclease/NACHT domain
MNEKPNVTKTTHVLPFGELSPLQFERLCLWLVEREGYLHTEHLGEAGSEEGRDVIGYRVSENDKQLWYFQCKRYQTIGAARLMEEVEKYNKLVSVDPTKKPFGIVFVTNATLSAAAREKLRRFCREQGYETEFWARTELDLLTKKHVDIVTEFFNLPFEPPSPSPSTPNVAGIFTAPEQLAQVLANSARTREALEPYVLPRLSRGVVHGKYLPQIAASLAQPSVRIIPIIGPAGYGKSTVLGEIYDQLAQRESSWVALIRCNDLQGTNKLSSIADLDVAMGTVCCGREILVSDLLSNLTEANGRGVLLVDTLDLILDEQLTPALRGVLTRLIDAHVTTVITCRDYEYRLFLEPPTEKLAGLTRYLYRYELPAFAPDEIRDAIQLFLSAVSSQDSNHTKEFIAAILELSADSRPLRQIVERPLLLAMLCELFGGDGKVPVDLTVSKLYNQYWERKIASDRLSSQRTPVAIEKMRLCLSLAHALYELSVQRQRLVLSIAETDLLLSPGNDTSTSRAYKELRSEGVLRVSPQGPVGFFHQTFVEYAIARWLSSRSGFAEAQKLSSSLNSRAAHSLYWYPVLRQLLTMLDEGECNEITERLGLNSPESFRTIAYAAAAREDATQLSALTTSALELGPEFQNILREAAESAPDAFAAEVWQILLNLIIDGAWSSVVKTAAAMGNLVSRYPLLFADTIREVLAAIEQRSVRESFTGQDPKATLVGIFLIALNNAGGYSSNSVLAAVRATYTQLPPSNRALIVKLHLDPVVTAEERLAMLKLACQNEADSDSREPLTELLCSLLPEPVLSSGMFGDTWIAVLYGPGKPGWNLVQAHAVGHLACANGLIPKIVHDLCTGESVDINRNLIALYDALSIGGGLVISQAIRSISAEDILTNHLKTVNRLIERLRPELDQQEKSKLAEWIKPLMRDSPDVLIPAYVGLTEEGVLPQDGLIDLIETLPPTQQVATIRGLLRNTKILPSTVASQLEKLLSDGPRSQLTGLARIELAANQARSGVTDAFEYLLDVAANSRKILSLAASNVVADLVTQTNPLTARDLLRLSQSPTPGVRVNWLKSLTTLITATPIPSQQDFADICQALTNERMPSVLQSLCTFVKKCIEQHVSLPVCIPTLVSERLRDHLSPARIEMGTVRAFMIMLQALVQTLSGSIHDELSETIRLLITSVDLRRVEDGESEGITLISTTARERPLFLAELVAASASLPIRNARALALAIKRVEGANSRLLDQMLANQTAPEVRSLIVSLRGA